MRYALSCLLSISILFICITAKAKADDTSDSIYTLKHVLKVHIATPDSALSLLNTMEAKKLEKLCLINAQRGIVYAGKGQQRMALNYALKAYQDTILRHEYIYYLQTMSCIVNAYKLLENHKLSIRYLTEGIKAAREMGHKQTEANFLFTMGENYYALNQKQEAYDYFIQAINLLENEESFRMKPYLSYFYGELTSYLSKEGKYKEAIAICNKREELINLMKKQDGIPLGYIDQQSAYLYIKQAYLYAKSEETEKALDYFSRFSATNYSKKKDMQRYVLVYQLAMKQYGQVLDYYEKKEPINQTTDTINNDFIEVLVNLSEACQGLSNYREALQYQKRIQVIEDSLNVRDKKETALELATIYKLQEKEWNIRQKDEQLHNSFIVQVLLGCAFVLALISLWLAIRHMNIIRKKNILMANKLDSLMSYEREIDRLHRQIAVIEESDQENSLNKSLFKKMERLIKDEKLYLIPELSRQDMLERLSIDKNRFGQMLQENTNMTFSQYLTEIRLKHALTELKIHPNYTIQAISEESGFANTRNFQRLFKAAFDMTPSDYKKIVQEKQHREPPMD